MHIGRGTSEAVRWKMPIKGPVRSPLSPNLSAAITAKFLLLLPPHLSTSFIPS